MQIITDLQDNIKESNIYVIGIPERKEREWDRKKYLKT